jgi:glycosyltransferase involved in cell wall biosynthesis
VLQPQSHRRRLGSFSFGVNVVGYLASEKGLGEAARSNLRILKAAGIPNAGNDFADIGSENRESMPENVSNDYPYDINLININPDQLDHFIGAYARRLLGRYNIGYWAWELSTFPPEWTDSYEYFDEVWVPSEFTRKSIAAKSPIPVRTVPHSIDPDIRLLPDRDRSSFRIPPDVFVFLFFFDFHSSMERKNPAGLIRAFRRAFGNRRDVMLFLKSSHSSKEKDELKRLESEIEGANIKIYDKVLSRQSVHSLMLLSDCYVSLHRSEGFGLTLSEAMLCGKPVIATAYSGNMDFMNEQNSFLVRYKLVEIKDTHGPYQAGYIWADPDIDHAAELMRQVFENRPAAAIKAQRAQADVISKLHPQTIAQTVKSYLKDFSGEES